jgi:hypothetical protein
MIQTMIAGIEQIILSHPYYQPYRRLFYSNTKARKRECVEAQMIVMYMCHKHLNFSLPTVAEMVRDKSHSSTNYAINQINNFLQIDATFSKRFTDIEIQVKDYIESLDNVWSLFEASDYKEKKHFSKKDLMEFAEMYRKHIEQKYE